MAQVLVTADGVLKGGGEAAIGVRGEAVLRGENTVAGPSVFDEEAGAECYVLFASVADDEGAAMEMKDHGLTRGPLWGIGVPCSADGLRFDLRILEDVFVSGCWAGFDGDPLSLLLERVKGHGRGEAQSDGVWHCGFEELYQKGLLVAPLLVLAEGAGEVVDEPEGNTGGDGEDGIDDIDGSKRVVAGE